MKLTRMANTPWNSHGSRMPVAKPPPAPPNGSGRGRRFGRRLLGQPVALATLFICVCLVLGASFAGDGGSDKPAAPAMAPVAKTDWSFDCQHLEDKAQDYCNGWYERMDGAPSILTNPAGWTKYQLNVAAQEVFTWWITAPDPVIGTYPGSQETVDWTKGHYGIVVWVLIITTGGFTLMIIGLSGDPQAGKNQLRAFFVVIISGGLAVPMVNALVRMSSAFSDYILVEGLPGNPNERNSQRRLNDAIRIYVANFKDDKFLLAVLFFCLVIIGCLALFVEMYFRLIAVILLVSMLPVSAAMSGTAAGRDAFRKIVFTWLIPLCLLDSIISTCMVIPLRLLDANNAQEGIQSGFLAAIIIGATAFVMPAFIRLMVPVAQAVSGGAGLASQLTNGAGPLGARVVGTAFHAATAAGAGPAGAVRGRERVRRPSGSGGRGPSRRDRRETRRSNREDRRGRREDRLGRREDRLQRRQQRRNNQNSGASGSGGTP